MQTSDSSMENKSMSQKFDLCEQGPEKEDGGKY